MNVFKLKHFFPIKMLWSRSKEKCHSSIKIPQEKGRNRVSSQSCLLTHIEMIITNPAHGYVSLLSCQRTYKCIFPSQLYEASRPDVIFPTWWLLFIFFGDSGVQWLDVWTLRLGVLVWIWVPALTNSVIWGTLLYKIVKSQFSHL